jgi:hypothetical protein
MGEELIRLLLSRNEHRDDRWLPHEFRFEEGSLQADANGPMVRLLYTFEPEARTVELRLGLDACQHLADAFQRRFGARSDVRTPQGIAGVADLAVMDELWDIVEDPPDVVNVGG